MTHRRAWLFIATVLGIIGVDQASKALVRSWLGLNQARQLLDGILWLTHVENTGAAFGLFPQTKWLLIAVAAGVLALIAYVAAFVRPENRWAQLALALIAGGAAGNLIDRLARGTVTDFFDLGWFPVFNVADICLDVGVAILVWWLVFGQEHAEVQPPGTTDEREVHP